MQLIYYATLLYDGSHLVVITVVVWEVEYQTGCTWVLKEQFVTSPTCLPTSLVHRWLSVCSSGAQFHFVTSDGTFFCIVTVVVWEVEYQTGCTWVLKGQVVTSPTRLPTTLVHRWLSVCSSGARFHVVTSDGTVFRIVTVVVWKAQPSHLQNDNF